MNINTTSIIAENKSLLRQKMRTQRREYALNIESYKRDADQICIQLKLFPLLHHDKIVSTYWPLADEIDPRPFMYDFIQRGGRIALPAVNQKAFLSFYLWDGYSTLTKTSLGILEPDHHLPTVDPDIILVPLLAFDNKGHRLGYGHGHFDRTLAKLRSCKTIIAIGLAFTIQKVDQLFYDAHDQRLDYVITPETLYRF